MQKEYDETYNGTASLHFTLKHKGCISNPGFLITIKYDKNTLSLSIRINKRQFKLYDTRHVKYSAKQIGRTLFKDVISVDSTNSKLFSYDESTPKSFLWSKSKGLIQYVYPNGDTYTFYKRIPHDNAPKTNEEQTYIDKLLNDIKGIIDHF